MTLSGRFRSSWVSLDKVQISGFGASLFAGFPLSGLGWESFSLVRVHICSLGGLGFSGLGFGLDHCQS